MAKQRAGSTAKVRGSVPSGPTAVLYLALTNRNFFERLLEDPRNAMDQMVREGELRLTEDDKRLVVELIAEGRKAPTGADALAQWDRHHLTGLWGPGWPILRWLRPG